jgi:hypothetical protein
VAGGLRFLNNPFALPADPGYCEGMPKAKSADPFVCNEPAVETSAATSRILKQRMRTADQGRLVSAEKARKRIQQWLSKSSTTKTR